MSRDKQNIKTTDWLTRGMTEEEIAREKEKAIKEAEAELREKQIEEMAKHLCCDFGGCDNCTLSNPESETPCTVRDDCETLLKAGYCKASDIALKIIGDIETLANNHIKGISILVPQNDFLSGGKQAFDIVLRFLAELKKKYIGEDTNVRTNTEEGK